MLIICVAAICGFRREGPQSYHEQLICGIHWVLHEVLSDVGGGENHQAFDADMPLCGKLS